MKSYLDWANRGRAENLRSRIWLLFVALECRRTTVRAGRLKDELNRADSPNFMRDPADVAEVIGRICARERSERYASLADVLEDLAIIEV